MYSSMAAKELNQTICIFYLKTAEDLKIIWKSQFSVPLFKQELECEMHAEVRGKSLGRGQ